MDHGDQKTRPPGFEFKSEPGTDTELDFSNLLKEEEKPAEPVQEATTGKTEEEKPTVKTRPSSRNSSASIDEAFASYLEEAGIDEEKEGKEIEKRLQTMKRATVVEDKVDLKPHGPLQHIKAPRDSEFQIPKKDELDKK